MITSRATTWGALALLVASCARKPADPAAAPAADAKAPPAATSASPSDAQQLPIPEAVARIHRNAFRDADPKLPRVTCVITLHDAALKRGEFFPLVLFADGAVATWRQTATGREEPFFAELGADEQARAAEWVDAIPRARDKARITFASADLVMGVSVRVGDRVETLWFEHDEVPAPLGSLVALLKHRLEATNR